MTTAETFEFLSPIDGNTYTLPAYDPEKFADEVSAHPDFIPKHSMTDVLLADDPEVGLQMLKEPEQRLHTLMVRGMVKTIRNHVSEEDPAWLALKAMIDGFEWAALGKLFREWREHSGDLIGVEPGEG